MLNKWCYFVFFRVISRPKTFADRFSSQRKAILPEEKSFRGIGKAPMVRLVESIESGPEARIACSYASNAYGV